jgi:transposase InsO family protein
MITRSDYINAICYHSGWRESLGGRRGNADGRGRSLLADVQNRQGIGRGQLTIHADRGSSMTSKPVALLLADLGVTQPIPARTCPSTTRTPRHSSRR